MEMAPDVVEGPQVWQFASLPPRQDGFQDFIEKVLGGSDVTAEAMAYSFPNDWQEQLLLLIEEANNGGDSERGASLRVLREWLCVSLRAREALQLREAMHVKDLCDRCGSPFVRTLVLGHLGQALIRSGIEADGQALILEAVDVATKSGLRSAAIFWEAHLAAAHTSATPEFAEKELRRLLSEARIMCGERTVGMILNNLAYINDECLSNLTDAITYQEESVAIAIRMNDRFAARRRTLHLAHLQERKGLTDLAISYYEQGIAQDSDLGCSDLGLWALRQLARLLSDKHVDDAMEEVSSHLILATSFEDLSARMIQPARGVELVMGRYHPAEGHRGILIERHFAGRLCAQKKWGALAVYAREWMEQGLDVDDASGMPWLAVSLRALGFSGAADMALQIAARLQVKGGNHK